MAAEATGREIFDFEPAAASRYDGDHECQYDCEETADWVVESKASGYTGGRVFFCCQSCSRDNRIYARENELYRADLSDDAAEVIPDSELEHVDDFAEGDS
ncbi:hypothetical protein HTZ84_22225 [Haloterrigena sp. SYSU A558-1]|uniref:Uncharacterized protein n=1 Tax=Haloterrigena gelatinilytica TaxID=2741724 RepID=A0ABX2LPC3_9EURY|nr:hypothetical protein [Haloterrigena gelatinilytica]NUC74984.1 hypothetical protein [Haloterrigena gelatinilytica]